MPIEWPTHFWKSENSDADTDEYRRAREKAVGEVYALRLGRPIVAVSGSGSSHEYKTEANDLGKLLAQLAFTMTSGGLDGIMFDVTDGYVHTDGGVGRFSGLSGKGAGRAIRIVPKGREDKAKELGERLPGAATVYTALSGRGAKHIGPSSRNHVLIATADAVICMPGDEGSIAEAMLAKQVYKKPVIAYAPVGGIQKEWHKAVGQYGILTILKKIDLEAWLNQKLIELSL
jgi:predicted Rossmann-fold nucleotide-binding protein